MSRNLPIRLATHQSLIPALCQPPRTKRVPCPNSLTPLDSALTQLFILNNFKFTGINTYEICMAPLSQTPNFTHHIAGLKAASRPLHSFTSFTSSTSLPHYFLTSSLSLRCSP